MKQFHLRALLTFSILVHWTSATSAMSTSSSSSSSFGVDATSSLTKKKFNVVRQRASRPWKSSSSMAQQKLQNNKIDKKTNAVFETLAHEFVITSAIKNALQDFHLSSDFSWKLVLVSGESECFVKPNFDEENVAFFVNESYGNLHKTKMLDSCTHILVVQLISQIISHINKTLSANKKCHKMLELLAHSLESLFEDSCAENGDQKEDIDLRKSRLAKALEKYQIIVKDLDTLGYTLAFLSSTIDQRNMFFLIYGSQIVAEMETSLKSEELDQLEECELISRISFPETNSSPSNSTAMPLLESSSSSTLSSSSSSFSSVGFGVSMLSKS